MTKIYTKEVKNCWECPNAFGHWKPKRYSCKENSSVMIDRSDFNDDKPFPVWCPLPDKKETEG